jgi:hypothetical protein
MTAVKYPAFGLSLAMRMKWKNPAALVIINCGCDGLERSLRWQKQSNNFAVINLVIDQPDVEELTWPVSGCVCLIEWGVGPSSTLIKRIYDALKKAGAYSIKVMALFEDYDLTLEYEPVIGMIETSATKREIDWITGKSDINPIITPFDAQIFSGNIDTVGIGKRL